MRAGERGQESGLSIERENPDQPEVKALLDASDAYAASLYPAESNHMSDLASLQRPEVRFFVARLEGACLGCGALIVAPDGTGEIKRMWVDPAARGQGLSRLLLAAIEAQAANDAATIIRLETGIHQPAAIALYKSAGYTEIGPFGSYEEDPNCLFMEKRLGGP
ncbi:MAG: GNAT family N-acetyltransferase [Pseudomonadota bacterium]